MNTTSTPITTRAGLLNYFSLFTSLSTLLCCALPSLLVLLGLGASVASTLVVSSMAGHAVPAQSLDILGIRRPDRVQLSEHVLHCSSS